MISTPEVSSNIRTAVAFILVLLARSSSFARDEAKAEIADATLWSAEHLERSNAADASTAFPFSFNYNGEDSHKIMNKWKFKRIINHRDESRVQSESTWNDPGTGLAIRMRSVLYQKYPVVEWTVTFKNEGKTATPILDSIRALDTRLGPRGESGADPVLHDFKGSLAELDDYRPRRGPIAPGETIHIGTTGGRPCNTNLPYFNLEWLAGGAIVAIGWPGQWTSSWECDKSKSVHVLAGQENTHFKLLPGEEVRTPLVALLFWRGDRIRSHNTWRRWLIEYNLPRPGGELPPPQLVACSSHQFGEMIGANEENQKLFIDRYLEEKLKIDYWWMDAGWYKNDGTWVNTGTWEVDPKRFPHGLRAITDHGREKGVRSIVWFEPERVTKKSELFEKHSEWLLSPSGLPAGLAYQNDWRLFNLGNPHALKWLIDHVDGLIRSQGIDLYRQDFNIDPSYFWWTGEPDDRKGIVENHYVQGYLAYWDELLRRNPKLRIDSCASGGRRNDLETLRRAVPLLRSDYLFEPTGQQCHTYGISFWYPYHGTGTLIGESRIFGSKLDNDSVYAFRSHMAPSVTACWDVRRKDLHYDLLRKLTTQLNKIQTYYIGDYYPLTPYSTKNDVWMAWRFDRPDLGGGVVQAFRRPDCPDESARFSLAGLDPAARYEIRDLDAPDSVRTTTGRELIDPGLTATIARRPGAVVLLYRKK